MIKNNKYHRGDGSSLAVKKTAWDSYTFEFIDNNKNEFILDGSVTEIIALKIIDNYIDCDEKWNNELVWIECSKSRFVGLIVGVIIVGWIVFEVFRFFIK